MASEATIQCSLQITKGHLSYRSSPTSFQADVNGSRGPSPGAVLVPTAGKDIYFDQLTNPSLCWMQNLDANNTVDVGIFDTITGRFHPLFELRPNEPTRIRLSRDLTEQYTGSGTGTTAPENYLRLKARVAACVVIIDAFDE